MASQSWLPCVTVILIMAIIHPSHAISVNAEDILQRRAPTQSEQAVNGNRGNITIAIAAASGVAGTILLTLILWKLNRLRKDRQAARYAAAHPEMAQAALLTTLIPPNGSTSPNNRTAGNGPSRPRRPRRQPSTQTVPEYSEQAGDEEMVLDKAEREEMHLENANPVAVSLLSSTTTRSSESDADAHYAATAAYTSNPRRTSYNFSRSTLQDIENPAPELRMDRVDTVQTSAAATPSVLSTSENGHLPLMTGTNNSALTLDEVPLDGLPVRQSSFFGSPAYVNRSRSRSIDIAHAMSSMQEQLGAQPAQRPPSIGSSLSVPQSRRQSSFMSLFPRRQSSSTNTTTVLPLHEPLTEARREALRNREISAPIGETLVRTSYTYPKAGINPIQAAWIGSRDHITRLTTYLDTAPPAFEEEDESLEMERRASRDTGSTSAQRHMSSLDNEQGDSSRPSASNVLSQMEEESAHLSSLVHQESLRRASLPPHMVALPPSLPVSPSSPRTYGAGNPDWPISRAASLARARSLVNKRNSMEQQNSVERQSSIARRRVQSAVQTSPTIEEARGNTSAVPELPRSESPSPLPRRTEGGNVARTDRPVLSVSTSSTTSSLQAIA